ncbi:unnamed protein product [Rotaria sp. Silwood2]|nr:unnamed protein product [Rotaria sp. Silwood2]
MSRSTFNTYIDTSIEQFQKDTFEIFRSFYHFVSSIVSESRFISALRTNSYTRSIPGSNISVTFSAIYPQQVNLNQSSSISNETCRCDRTTNCIYPAGIYNESRSIIPNEVFSFEALPTFIVPGFQVGCIPQNALLQSTLECLYNQSCLDILISLTGAVQTTSALNISNSFSKFNPTTTIGILFDNLMIESWENSTDFATYFQKCAPKACSYSYVQRFFLIYMITTLASIFGGLNIALRIISPLFVKFILRLSCRRVRTLEADAEHGPKRNLQDHVSNFIKLIFDKVVTLNLFKTTFANVQHVSSQQVIVRNPSLDQFKDLHDTYSSMLSCPCRRSLIPRSTFFFCEAYFHPFCKSSFVRDDRWHQYWTMRFLNGTVDPMPPFYWTDFRKNGMKFFNYVKIFCDMANRRWSEIVNSFQREYLLSFQPMTEEQFNETIIYWEGLLRGKIYEIYYTESSPVEESIRNNELISFDFIDPSIISRQINNTWTLKYATGNINNYFRTPCDCMQVIPCLKPLGFYGNSSSYTQIDTVPHEIIPGLYLGCQFLDFKYSTLECFYNESCVQMLIDHRLYGYENIYLPIDLSHITALNPDEIMILWTDSPLYGFLVQSLMYDWVYKGNYTVYFAQCQPEICTYTIGQKLNPIGRINLVIGLIGGFTVILHLLIPSFIKIIYLIYHLCYQQTRNNPLRWRMIISYIRDEIYRMNVYRTKRQVEYQHLATRIYIVLLILSFVIISVFVRFQYRTVFINIDSPNETYFAFLHSQYSDRLSCPCTNITISFASVATFFSETTQEACFQSNPPLIFMAPWMLPAILWEESDWTLIRPQFRILYYRCSFEIMDVTGYLLSMVIRPLVSVEAMTLETFNVSFNSFFTGRDRNSLISPDNAFKFVCDMLQANQFQNRYMTSWKAEYSSLEENYILRSSPVSLNNGMCFCPSGKSNCTKIPIYYDQTGNSSVFPVVESSKKEYG